MNTYTAAQTRYDGMQYRYAGHSGLKLPVLSLGLWHNFGDGVDDAVCRQMIATAFDHGITHFDLANNYGPPAGSAEARFGRMLSEQFGAYRDEMLISTKAGYYMWPGPYGDWGSRKYLIASCDASLKRMGLEYVDIFYHHRPDPNTPLEETMGALAQLVRQGKALYVGISNYHRAEAVKAIALLKELGCPCVLNQVRYSLLDRWVEDDHLLDGMKGEAGAICFSPLAQGLLSDRYLEGTIPPDSRASKSHFLKPETITKERVQLLNGLNAIARKRGQSLSEMAISWLLVDKRVTSVLIGASSAEQVKVNLKAVGKSPDFSQEELSSIDELCMRWK
ncbi:MAG: aldo/keto reductase [Sphaerochaeta sp.]|jgi:L-glyceraldehyde 3-phosphate reductase|uniref:aldo/keto reductase n=1 Tax=Sphaerochaeta sp. TaxID=1972642 RepID=UPI002A35FBB6|nr:aldo/keto reductase [Sphaerochaeta sp.]MDX9823766.1 aldo/keto reductase [Sphaerochaeta sp.]